MHSAKPLDLKPSSRLQSAMVVKNGTHDTSTSIAGVKRERNDPEPLSTSDDSKKKAKTAVGMEKKEKGTFERSGKEIRIDDVLCVIQINDSQLKINLSVVPNEVVASGAWLNIRPWFVIDL